MPRTRPCVGDAPIVVTALVARTIALTLLLLVLWSLVPRFLGWHVTTVVSGSMQPAIAVGDVVAAVPVDGDDVTPGQVLLVDDPDHADRLRLHRLHDVEADGSLRLWGDANPSADTSTVSPDAVLGVGFLRVPWIGLPMTWIRDGDVVALVTGGLALALVIRLSTADRRLLTTPCRRCGIPRAQELAAPGAGPGPTTTLTVGIAALAVAALAMPSGAAFSGSTDSTSRFGSHRFPCFTDVADAPVLAYGFGEPAGIVVDDRSGNGHDGVLWNGARRVDASCTANPYASFDARNGVHATGPAVDGPQVFSAEAWFRTTRPQGKIVGFGNRAEGGSTSYDRHLYIGADGRLVFGVHDGGALVVQSSEAVTDGQWHHAVGTLSAAGIELWVDGVRVAADPAVTHAKPYKGYWRVGYDNVQVGWPNRPASHYFDGDVDSVAVYDRVLEPAVIAAHAASGR